MADETIVALNVEAVARALRDFPQTAEPLIRQAVERWQLRRQAELARYPSPPAGSTYQRTGTLGRRWTSARPTWQARGSGFESRIGNNTPYAPYVQGQRQARVHVGRWKTAEQIGQDAQGELDSAVQSAVQQAEQQANGVTS